MVTEASNYGAREAKAIGLVEVVSPTLPALLDEVDGMKTVPKGLVLATAGAEIEDVEMSFWQRARDLSSTRTSSRSCSRSGFSGSSWSSGTRA